MQDIHSSSLDLYTLLKGRKYILEYFQREYNWRKINIENLIDDLVEEFKLSRDSSYFLGSVIVSKQNDDLKLIDGQQRLTSLLLILIYIARRCESLREQIFPLVYHELNDTRIYTVHDFDRSAIMDALCNDEKINVSDSLVSVKNIQNRFSDVKNCFQNYDFSDDEIIDFADWLTKQVYIAEIRTSSTKDGYKIFEAANDRGVSLTSVELLKSYLLSKLENKKEQNELNEIWKERIDEIDNANEKSDEAIRSWLRATFAQNDSDFEAIGSKFHSWLKDIVEDKEGAEYFKNLIENNFTFYTEWYLKLRKVGKKYFRKHEAIFCNQKNSFTLQYPVILSSLNINDDDVTIWKKIHVIATFLDIFIARHLWNGKESETKQRLAKFSMMEIIIKIRGKNLREIVNYLTEEIEKYDDFEMYVVPDNAKSNREFLIRFSAWLDNELEISDSSLDKYYNNSKYKIGNIIPNKYHDYEKITNELDDLEFESEDEFKREQSRFGALLLLSSQDYKATENFSYEEKIQNYTKQHMILPKTLAQKTYETDFSFIDLNKKYQFGFEHHEHFLKADIEKRHKVYAKIAQAIWNPQKLKEIAEADIADDDE